MYDEGSFLPLMIIAVGMVFLGISGNWVFYKSYVENYIKRIINKLFKKEK